MRRRAIVLCAALAVPGCGTAATSVAPQAPSTVNVDTIAKKVDLLYISDGNGEVTVYTYFQKTLVGVLTGFTRPEGECADSAGNVFITDYGAKQIVEYAHAGKKPLATIDDAPYAPFACSVNPKTGALAVANDAGTSSGGNIAIFANASGAPVIFTDKRIRDFQACAYDNDGNLLASNGQADSRYSSFAWLPRNGAKLLDVTLPGPRPSSLYENVSGIQWDGKYWVIDEGNLYRVSLVSGQGFYVGETSLNIFGGQGGPFWIYNSSSGKQGTQVVGPVNEFSNSEVEYWNYPGGGDSIGYVSKSIDKATAVTVSLGKIHE